MSLPVLEAAPEAVPASKAQSRTIRRDGLLALAVALLMLASRDWIILVREQRGWLGVYGDPNVLLANKLSGWFHLGVVMGRWRPSWFMAGMFWEWLPAAVFCLGLGLFLRQFPAPVPVRWRLRGPWPLLVAAALVGVGGWIALACFGGISHVQDSIAQEFQAQVFARGYLFAPVPTGVQFLGHEFLVQHDGRWFAQYPPMQAALLAIGILAGASWLVNPILGALSALFLYGAAKRTYGRRTARVSLLFYAASPFVWFMSGERMNHVGTLFFLSAALYALAPALSARGARMSSARWLWAALSLGLAIATRPLCGVAAAVPLLLGALWPRFKRNDGDAQAAWLTYLAITLPVLGVGVLLGAAPLLLFNWATTGSPLLSGYELNWGNSGMGFGNSQWGPPHTPMLGLEHLLSNWDGAAKYLYEWPVPCLLPLLGLFFLRRRSRMDYAMLGLLASVTLAYFPYFYQDLCLGPRFLYAAIPAFMLLSARGLFAAGAAWGERTSHRPRQGVVLATQGMAFCAVVGLAFNVPVLSRYYSNNFWGTTRRPVDAARAMHLGPSVVFIRDYAHSRAADMLELGVSRAVAQGAVERLSEQWLDDQIAEAQALPRDARGEWLESMLASAIDDPRQRHKRLHPPWVDRQGFTASVYSGLWANTPWPQEQEIIFALDRGPRNRELLQEYPGRTPWRFDFDGQTSDFCLMPFRQERETGGVRLTHNTAGTPRKAKTP